MKYSLWLMPSGKRKERFQKIIGRLAKEHKTHTFKPHVTLLGNSEKEKKEVLQRADKLSQLLKKFTIKLNETVYMNEYYKCILVKAQNTDELVRANNMARRIYDMDDQEFMPHLSLMYGDFSNKLKEKIVEKLGNFDEEFSVNKLHVVNTKGKPEEWKIIKEFPFGR